MKKQNLLSMRVWVRFWVLCFFQCFALTQAFFLFLLTTSSSSSGETSDPKYIIVMIADGWGAKQIEAAAQYIGTLPLYQVGPAWREYWMSTFPLGGSYETTKAWNDFNYVLVGPVTDSAASSTALYSGNKTQNKRISVSGDGSERFLTIAEIATKQWMGTGAVSTVPVSHATPGAWIAHNDDRNNVYAIASEGFFNDPNATGLSTQLYYGGGHGSTFPSADVIIGSRGTKSIDSAIITKLRKESGKKGKHFLVEEKKGKDGGKALLSAASNPGVTKLAGLFDHVFHKADDSGFQTENPTLSDSTSAALTVLNRNSDGFVLMIEGGAIDWACHSNSMDHLIGEMIDFNEAVQTVSDWVDDPVNGSSWHNTLVIVTGDHETGYLTAGPGLFPDVPLGGVNSETVSHEKIYSGSGGRSASWEDSDGDSVIDPGETVYWVWNSGSHTNLLIPLYARGVGSELFANDAMVFDTMRGFYLDNTDVFYTMKNVIGDLPIVPVTWVDTVGVVANDNSITKTVSAGWGNGGAASLESFTGSGGVEFTASEADASANGRPVCGLSSTDRNASYNTIDYAIYLRNTGSVMQLQIYEKGENKGTFGTYRVGDVFRVQRIGSTIVYKKNGIIFYTSSTPTDLPLLVDTAIYNTGGEIRDVKVFGGAISGGKSDTIPPSTPTNLITTSISSSQINLSWDASTDNEAVTGYRIYRDGTQIATTAGTTYQDTGLSALTRYTYTVSAFDAVTNESTQSIVDSNTTLDSNGVSVTWVDTVGLVVNGNSITKTAFAGWGNGGAASLESFTGNGGVEFSASTADASAYGRPMCGLSSKNRNASYDTIEYAIYLRNTGSFIQLQVFEKGREKGTFGTYRVGDIFKIERISSTIVYKKNGDTFYTSATPTDSPLMVDTAIYNTGGEIRDVKVFGVVPVKWVDMEGVVANGNSIIKTASTGWGNGGAASLESFTGNGGVEFTASQADASAFGRPMCGLSSTNRNVNYNTIEYAIYLRNTGSIMQLQVYEKGIEKGTFGTYRIGDVFRVQRIGSTIVYKKNGIIFYTSATSTDLPLLIDTAIYNDGGEIRDVKVFGVDTGGGPTDTTQPSTPTKLITTPISSSQINLSWDASTDNEAVTGYRIYRDGTQITTTAGTTYQDTGLSALTKYTYTVSAFDAATNESAQSIVDSNTTLDSNGVSVTWVDTVGLVVNGNSITKTASAGWGNGGAASLESFTGNGGVEFSASAADASAYGRPMCGLSSKNRNASYDTIEYAIYLRNTGSFIQLQVYEKGIEKGTFGTYRVGDIFKIERIGSTIVYKKNGVAFYTSATPTDSPLMVDTAIYNTGGEIRDVKVFGVVPVKWVDMEGVVANSNSIIKTASTGWGNGGAASLESFTGNGGVEFTASQADASAYGRPMCGLSSTNRNVNYNTIEYAIYLRNTGSLMQLQVYEKGIEKGTFGTYRVGDVFRVQRIGSTIVYKKNGDTFYTSATPTDLPLLVDTAIYNTGGEIRDVKVFGIAGSKVNRPPVLDQISGVTVTEGDTDTLTTTGLVK